MVSPKKTHRCPGKARPEPVRSVAVVDDTTDGNIRSLEVPAETDKTTTSGG